VINRESIAHKQFEISRFDFYYVAGNEPMCIFMDQLARFFARSFNKAKHHTSFLVHPKLMVFYIILILNGFIQFVSFFYIINPYYFIKLVYVHVEWHSETD
jgi:hypothetical protein